MTSQLAAATAAEATAAAAAAAFQQQLAAAVKVMAAAGLDTSAFTAGQESSETVSEKTDPEPEVRATAATAPTAAGASIIYIAFTCKTWFNLWYAVGSKQPSSAVTSNFNFNF